MTQSAVEVMKACDFGEARYFVPDDHSSQGALLVRERSDMIRYLGQGSVEFRPGMFLEKGCAIIIVLLRAGRFVRQVYPTWWDYHAPGGAEAFELLKSQEALAICFHGNDAHRERTFVVANPLAAFFSFAQETVTRMPAWTPEEYGASLRQVIARAGSLEGLWEELTQKGPQGGNDG